MQKQTDDPANIAARKIVPIIIKIFRPRSVVDIGCGSGAWLRVFEEYGVTDYIGIDVNPPIHITADKFIHHDLRKNNLPPQLNRKFDLTLCLEVAEHLPEKYAEHLITTLCKLSDVICFSAAVPFQGGHGHVNERWPEYWARLFYKHGYRPVDIIRPEIWYDHEIPFWYKQNILIYVKEEIMDQYKFPSQVSAAPLSIIHPQLYLSKLETINNPTALTLLLLTKRYLMQKMFRHQRNL